MSTRREEEEVMDDREERIHFITYIAYLNCSVAKSLSLITGVLASCHFISY